MATALPKNGTALAARVERLEEQLETMAWLHAEQAQKIVTVTTIVAALLAQQMQAQVQKAVLDQLLGKN